MFDTIRERLIHLHECPGIGWMTLFKMLKYDASLSSIYTLSPHELMMHFHIPHTIIADFYKTLHSPSFPKKLQYYQEKGILIITIMDEAYPVLLKEIYRPPWVLYAMGDVQLLARRKNLAVVGTRQPTDYGKSVTRQLVKGLLQHDFVITSGLAKGIDYEAHMSAIKGGGKTIAVIAGGFEHIYPREHRGLAKLISQDHLLLSEYPPYIRPQKYQFPERNRIISGLSIGTLVIEAKEKSGSLITANMALQEGREVFAVPGPITKVESAGTNRLIQDGAKLVLSPDDIITELAPILNGSS